MRGKRVALAAVATLALCATVIPPTPGPVAASDRYRVYSRRVAPGLRLLRIRDNRGPNQIRVLNLWAPSALTLHVELATEEIPGHETTSSMATRNAAVAAINGDFTLLPGDPRAGRPVHTFAEDAELVTSPLLYGRNFAQTRDESAVYIGHPRFRAWVTQQDSGEKWTVPNWNQLPLGPDALGVFTVRGGRNHPPPRNACAARLYPTTGPAFASDLASTEQLFTVSAVKCSSTRMTKQGGTVIAAPVGSATGTALATGLVPGETVVLGWTTGWPNVNETIGGNPTLLENGVITVEPCTGSYFCYRNPRTGIGVTARGRILLVTVDGRRDRSVGMTPVQFARLFQWLGATSALNLDGGGSTTMWVRGRIVNRPSDGSERAVGSAVLVVPGPEPTVTPMPTPVPTSTQIEGLSIEEPVPATGAVGCAALKDPASTGGLAEYLSLRNPKLVSRGPLATALETFRGNLACPAPATEPKRS